MPIQDKLPYALGRKDQGPNKMLADEIVKGQESLKELVDFLESKPRKEFQKDAALTIGYVAEQAPQQVEPYFEVLIRNLDSKINRVVWASMISLFHISSGTKKELFDHLGIIIQRMDEGTVVTRDYGIRILMALYQEPSYREDCLPLILEQISMAPSNQTGQYTERFGAIVSPSHIEAFVQCLEEKLLELNNEHHIKRVKKTIKKLYK